jgi:hypothetical protein
MYLTVDGQFDSCITIRSLQVRDHTAYIRAGAGIVHDSVPPDRIRGNRAQGRLLHQGHPAGRGKAMTITESEPSKRKKLFGSLPMLFNRFLHFGRKMTVMRCPA